MPKETLNISNFIGGMNTDLEARDLADNEFAYLSNFTGTEAGILKLIGQFTFVGDTCAGTGLSEDDAWTSHQGKMSENEFNIPPWPPMSLRGGYGLFVWDSDYNILNNYNSYLSPTTILSSDSRISGGGYHWEYYGDGAQQTESTGRGNLVGGVDNGHLPAHFYGLKQQYNYYGPELTLLPHHQYFYLTSNQEEEWGGGTDAVTGDYIQGILGSYGKDQIWPNYYAPDGALRCGQGNHIYLGTHPKWFGYIPKKRYGVQKAQGDYAGIGSVDVGGGWQIRDAGVERGPYRLNTRMINSHAHEEGIHTAQWSKDVESSPMVDGITNAYWGISLDFQEEPVSSGTTDAQTGLWQPTESTRYKFYVTYLFDDMKQESHPTLMIMYPTAEKFPDDGEFWTDSTDYGPRGGVALGAGAPEMYFCGVDESDSESPLAPTGGNVNDLPTKDAIVLNQAIYFKPVIRLSGHPTNSYTIVNEGGTNTNFTVTPIPSALTAFPSDEIDSEDKYMMGGKATQCITDSGNKRITGIRYYYSSNEDGHDNLYAMFEADFVKGVRAYGMGVETTGVGSWTPWENHLATNTPGMAANGQCVGNIAPAWSTAVRFKEPPRDETYASLNGRPHDVSITANWKTSTYVKGRMYIANYKRPLKTYAEAGSVWHDETLNPGSTYLKGTWGIGSTYDAELGGTFVFPRDNGDGPYGYSDASDNFFYDNIHNEVKIYSDKVCKSPPGEYDIFPQVPGKFEMDFGESDDGDEIIHLDTTHDKLLVFKKNSMIIVTPGDTLDTVDATHYGLGLDGQCPSQVCKTDHGIAWVNSKGCYHYDGVQVKELSGAKISSFIKNEGHNALPFNTDGENEFLVKSLRWSVPDSFQAPCHDEYSTNGPSLGTKYPHGDIVQSIGFDPESKKLLWLKNVGYTQSSSNTNAQFSDSSGGAHGNPMAHSDGLIYDFKTNSWSLGRGLFRGGQGCSNFVNFKGKLIFQSYDRYTNPKGHFDVYGANYPTQVASPDHRYANNIYQWTDDPVKVAKRGPRFCHQRYAYSSNAFGSAGIITKDFTFGGEAGDPSTRKKIYKVYITYRCKYGTPNIQVKYRVNGSNCIWDEAYKFTSKVTIDGTEETGSDGELAGPTYEYGWAQVELKPATPSEANNVYSFQLWIAPHERDQVTATSTLVGTVGSTHNFWYSDMGTTVADPGLGYIDSSFEINDITIVYRKKGIK